LEPLENQEREIDQRIIALDATIKRQADETLRQIYDDYQKMIIERIRLEQALAQNSRRNGDPSRTKRHEILADVWTSLLNSDAIALRNRQLTD
jgi:hypothetical protein